MFARAHKLRVGSTMTRLLQGRCALIGKGQSSARNDILTKLHNADESGTTVILRRVHEVLELEQPVALRWIRDLEAENLIQMEAPPHDLLEAEVSLTERGIALVRASHRSRRN